MAIITGLADTREIEILRAAGYEFTHPDMSLVEPDVGAVAVWVTCSITDLLSPPLCKFCGRLMETRKVADGEVLHVCECGARVQVRVYSPWEE